MDQLLDQLITPANIVTFLIFKNFMAFAAFGLDKMKAEKGQWRIPEATLLKLAFFGGTLGAYAGRALFRHKTRKQPFCSNLKTIAVLQVIAIVCIVGWRTAGPELRSCLKLQAELALFAETIGGEAECRPTRS